MFIAYGRFWEFHIVGYIVTNVTNQLFLIVCDVQYIYFIVPRIALHLTIDIVCWIFDRLSMVCSCCTLYTKVLIFVENKVHIKVFHFSLCI